jgi:photosystem II stability/assembly factor-like uncharacterized protein
MKSTLSWLCAAILLIFFVSGRPALAQWKIVQPHMIPPPSLDWGGAMSFRDGITWLARESIYRSTDSGVTWTKRADLTKLTASGYITDLDFFDKTHGLFVAAAGAYTTNDGGFTWTRITNFAHTACFGDDVKTMAVGSAVTTNGGAAWFAAPFSNATTFCVRPIKKRGTFAYFAGSGVYGNLFQSSNGGTTWKQGKTGVDEDSWSFAVDSCNDNRIYLAHEDYAFRTDDFSKIFVSPDRGDSWTRVAIFPEPWFAGSIAISRSALYCTTIGNGIYRSIDRGLTWQPIGGPNSSPDTRLITAIDDDVVVAVDSAGTVWRTANSGGNPVMVTPPGSTVIGPPVLFASDTAECDSLVRSIHILYEGCGPPSPIGWSVRGADSSSFFAGPLAGDSLRVRFQPQKYGSSHALIVFAMTDGSRDTIQLAGFNISVKGTLAVAPHTLFASDTIRCDSITRTLAFHPHGCLPPGAKDYTIIGPDSDSFIAGRISSDSLAITLIPRRLGDQHASIIIHRTDGTSDTVALLGVNSRLGSLWADRTLFAGDTSRCDTLVRTLLLHPRGCTPPSVIGSSIIGADSINFSIGALRRDSLDITFSPQRPGVHRATLVLLLSDSTRDTVQLGVFNDVGSFKPAAASLFIGDTVHCDSVTRTLPLRYLGCAPPTPLRWSLHGADSASYSIAATHHDSISVAFAPNVFGSHNALLVGELSDGTRDTITLSGFAGTTPFIYALSAQDLYTTDSLYLCEQPKVEHLSITSSACPPRQIKSQTIIGAASADYAFARRMPSPVVPLDSIAITFVPGDTGLRSASYSLTLDDGTQITIPLIGYGRAPHPLALRTSDQSSTTLGGTVEVPITINGLIRAEDVEIVLHYDASLPYQGPFSLSNAILDVPNEQWLGRSKLRIAQAVSGQVAGYARFLVFNDSLTKQEVSFDSMRMITELFPCEYVQPESVRSTISPPKPVAESLYSRATPTSDKLPRLACSQIRRQGKLLS